MRFKGPLMEAILEDRKTVTRRLVLPSHNGVCPWKVGRVYMATNRPRFEASGRKSNAKGKWDSIPIRIVSTRKERLSDIVSARPWDYTEAFMEGFEWERKDGARELSPNSKFFIAWGSIHGWPDGDPEVWRVEFTKAPKSWKREPRRVLNSKLRLASRAHGV